MKVGKLENTQIKKKMIISYFRENINYTQFKDLDFSLIYLLMVNLLGEIWDKKMLLGNLFA
jgi:hypothetical protein